MRGKLAVAAILAGGAAALGAYGYSRNSEPLKVNYSEAPTKILIVGGGFGGLAAAEELVRAFGGSEEIGVGMLDQTNYTTFYPMVARAISSNIEVRHMARSIRRQIQPMGMEFFQATVEDVDFEAQEVKTNVDSFPYDYLVLAPGSRTAFFDTEGVQKNAIDLKGLREALGVRNRIIDCFEEAERLRGDFSDDLLTFVFVGGGPTGVEGAAYAHELIFKVLTIDYPRVDLDRVHIVLVNSGQRILKGIDESMAENAVRQLEEEHIEVINDAKVTEIQPDSVTLDSGRTIPTQTTVWAAGVEPPPLVSETLDVQKDKRGNILVDEFLRVEGRPGVYAVGDCVCVDDEETTLPPLAQAAEQSGKVAGYNLAREIRGGDLSPFRYDSAGTLVDLGVGSSEADIMGIKLTGLLGELAWRAVYIRELGYNVNRVQVLVDWLLNRVSRPDTSKIFEEV